MSPNSSEIGIIHKDLLSWGGLKQLPSKNSKNWKFVYLSVWFLLYFPPVSSVARCHASVKLADASEMVFLL